MACCGSILRLLVFVCMPPPPPRSTLFPYTTLFRSYRSPERGDQSLQAATDHLLRCRSSAMSPHRLVATPRIDRKSTRLNSSHLVISYAVFCLKKKRRKPGNAPRPARTQGTGRAHTE